ncbi:hypothetical protein I79_014773 [Cricetulus griseus]|uniref:Uncharacterized protein n=1 Tax=Cricetulus griseus TaxID=10029 RepID=G3HV00_CRIGR|nr:hypothetical protein I79_014773 [Cricetulus griseus]
MPATERRVKWGPNALWSLLAPAGLLKICDPVWFFSEVRNLSQRCICSICV